MKLNRHTLSRSDLKAIAEPGTSGSAARTLVAAERSKHMLLVRATLDLARDGPAAGRAAAAYDVLARVGRLVPRAADAVICSPAVGAWAMRLIRCGEPSGSESAGAAATRAADGLTAIAAAAAVLGGVDCQINVPVIAGAAPAVMLPSVGYATFADAGAAAGAAILRVAASRARITCGGSQATIPADPRSPADRWHPVPAITADSNGRRLVVLLDVQSPHRHPGNVIGPGRLRSGDIERWREIISAGWRILAHFHPTTAADVSTMIRVLSPLRAAAGSQFSITARESFGAVALSLPTDDLTMAVTLAHEVQHTKLMALEDLFPLLSRHDTRGYYAPWRDDPRPLSGLLQGAFAYFGVTGFWRRQRHYETSHARALRAHTEFARWRVAARDVADLLARSGALTPHGHFVVDAMRPNLNQWCAEPVPAEAVLAAKVAAARHRARWLREYERSDPAAGRAHLA